MFAQMSFPNLIPAVTVVLDNVNYDPATNESWWQVPDTAPDYGGYVWHVVSPLH
jgi:hypothetical protein